MDDIFIRYLKSALGAKKAFWVDDYIAVFVGCPGTKLNGEKITEAYARAIEGDTGEQLEFELASGNVDKLASRRDVFGIPKTTVRRYDLVCSDIMVGNYIGSSLCLEQIELIDGTSIVIASMPS